MKVIIVGGVAGGASCAARLRRLDEKAEILLVERGPMFRTRTAGFPTILAASLKKSRASSWRRNRPFARSSPSIAGPVARW